jgi:hypothetical protein
LGTTTKEESSGQPLEEIKKRLRRADIVTDDVRRRKQKHRIS